LRGKASSGDHKIDFDLVKDDASHLIVNGHRFGKPQQSPLRNAAMQDKRSIEVCVLFATSSVLRQHQIMYVETKSGGISRVCA
jgi:hypothetical protein